MKTTQQSINDMMSTVELIMDYSSYTPAQLAFGLFFTSIVTYNIYETENVGALLGAVASMAGGEKTVELAPDISLTG